MNAAPATDQRTVDDGEVAKFSLMAATWWDEGGTSGPLHRLNPVRMAYIRKRVEAWLLNLPLPAGEADRQSRAGEGQLNSEPLTQTLSRRERGQSDGVNSLKPFIGLAFADIGCGGGVVCEPLARLGAAVTGIDASGEAIAVAQAHADEAGLRIDYRACTSDDLAATGARFDVVLALEVVEHVAEVPAFIASLKALLKPNGLLIMSTPNRTPQSYLSVIVGAERVMRWLPRGTHEWKRFLKPSELARHLRANGFAVRDVSGIVYDPIKRLFALSETDVGVNYLVSATLSAPSSS